MTELTIGQSATLTDFAMCVNHYRLSTPGLHVCVHATVQLRDDLRVISGLLAQVNNGPYKQCDTWRYEFFVGAPNFVFDVFPDGGEGRYRDRRALFEAAGVIEYVVWIDGAPIPIWNRLNEGKYTEVEPDDAGLIKSAALPGMWIPVAALERRDWWSIMACISQGITRRGHRDFMATIWKD